MGRVFHAGHNTVEPHMEPYLRFYLFGPFEVWRGGERIPARAWRTRKHAALLKILLGERGRVVPADRLIEWLWPDLPPRSGQANLHVGISLLRRVLEPGLSTPAASTYILTRRPGYLFDPSPGCWIDTDEFQAHIAEARVNLQQGEQIRAIRAYEAAAGRYRGDYLAEDPYEDWAIGPRERLREVYLEAVGQLSSLHLATGDASVALNWAQRLLELDPCREEAHRLAMRSYYALGRQADALRQFERCWEVLQEELSVEPMPRTLLLHQQILSGAVVLAADNAVVEPELAPLPFVGREAEMAVLRGLLDGVRREGCQVVLVHGEAGVGKTRLIEEFAARAGPQGVALLQGRCYALEQDMPYQPLREALSGALAGADVSTLVRDLGPWAGVVAALLPALWERCPDLEPPPPLGPAEERARLLHGLARLLQVLSAAGPLLVFMDDLHWADGATLQALHYLAGHLQEHAVLLVGAYRTGEVETAEAGAPTIARLLTDLRRAGWLTEIPLNRLSQEEVMALVAAIARSPYGGKLFSQRLFQGTGGNPLFLVETLRALLEQGILYRDESGAWATTFDEVTEAYEELPIPATVREVLLERCRRLSEQYEQALAAAAVVGRAFEFDLWLRVTGTPEVQLVDALDHCLARQLLIRQDGDRYDFVHGVIREVLYRELSPERRRVLHRRVADALVECGGAESMAGEIAHHYLESEMWEMALEYLERAGSAALGIFAYDEAWPYFDRAYQVANRLGVDDAERRYPIVRQMHLVCSMTGRRDEAGRYLEEALGLARALDDPARIAETLHVLCRYCFFGGEIERARELCEEAIVLSRQAGDLRQEANALRQYSYICRRSGRHEEATAALEQALQLSRQIEDRQVEALSLNLLGSTRYNQGDYLGALALYEQGLHISREIGFKPLVAEVAGNLGEVYRVLGCYPEALAYRREGLEMARAIGYRIPQPDCLLDIGMAHSDLGRHDEAAAIISEALVLAREIGHRHLVVHVLNGLARVLLRMRGGDQGKQALALVDEALDVARAIGLRQGEMMALSLRGRALLALGQIEAAAQASQAAVELLEGHGLAGGGVPSVYYHHAQVLVAQGRPEAARTYLVKAKAEMEAQAGRISDAGLRRSFLENVPINRRIAALDNC